MPDPTDVHVTLAEIARIAGGRRTTAMDPEEDRLMTIWQESHQIMTALGNELDRPTFSRNGPAQTKLLAAKGAAEANCRAFAVDLRTHRQRLLH